jgi:hypothetical protein
MLLTTSARSFLGVFTGIHHDNNHYLNTIWIMAVGAGHAPEVYRLPNILGGTAAIPLMATSS